ncbi:MAG: ankyrin repeat domain-containing protein [Gammaproteobacteria bacterium]
MTASDRKESKVSDPRLELNPFFHIPKGLDIPLDVEIDDFTMSLLTNEEKWTVDDSAAARERYGEEAVQVQEYIAWLATEGQQYVPVLFVKDGVAHLRADPSFSRVYTEEMRQEDEFFNNIRKYAADHFKCKEQEIIFPNDKIWAGVVHSSKIENSKEREPALVQDSTIISLSLTKINGKYVWKNRAARNSEIFSPDPLALAYYMFYPLEKYKNEPNLEFDRFYHEQRSVPEAVARPVLKKATKQICGDENKADFSNCVNFDTEKEWQQMCEEFKSDRPKVEKLIKEKLMTNLYIYLSNLHAKKFRDKAEEILKAGLVAATEHGISIDLDFIPPEFKDQKKTALEVAIEKKDSSMINFILDLDFKLALERGDVGKLQKIANKIYELRWNDPKRIGDSVYEQNKHEFKELLNSIIEGKGQINSQGKTLLHIIAALDKEKQSAMMYVFLNNLKTIDLKDNLGRSPLFYAVESSNIYGALALLKSGANPHVVDKKGDTPFVSALGVALKEKNTESTEVIQYILKSKAQFPDSYATISDIFNTLHAMILHKMSVEDGKPELLIDSLITAFNNQKNVSIKAQLQNVLLKSIYSALEAKNYPLIAKLAKLNQTEFPLLADFDRMQLSQHLVTELKTPGYELQKAACIDCLLKSDSTLGACLLKEGGELRAELENEKASKLLTGGFIKLVEAGELFNARRYIQDLSEKNRRELFIGLKDSFYKHLARILSEKNIDFSKKDAHNCSLTDLAYLSNNFKMEKLFSYINKPELIENDLIEHLKQNSMRGMSTTSVFTNCVSRAFSELELSSSLTITPEIGRHLFSIIADEKPDFNKKNSKGKTLIEMVAALPGYHVQLFEVLLSKIADPKKHEHSLSPSIKLLEQLLADNANHHIIIYMLQTIEPKGPIEKQQMQKLFLNYVRTCPDEMAQERLLATVSASFLMKPSDAKMFSAGPATADNFLHEVNKMKEEVEAKITKKLQSDSLAPPPLLAPPPSITRD